MARLFTPSESKYYLMALDAGTGSIRTVIFDLEGNQIAVGQAEWRHLAVPDVPACNLQQIADFSNIHPTSLVFAGGGSKGKLWSQILADVSGLPVNIPVVKEATALGCAIAAGVGAGIFSSMAETGERLVRWERTHTPDPEKHELYQDSRDKWQAVYQDQLGLVDHGLTTSLWKAPGL